jgi:hypothetical protein
VIELLERPVPTAEAITVALVRLESALVLQLPAPRSREEADLFDALSVMFVMPAQSRRAREAVRTAVGDTTFELLVAYLAFVRTAHFWTEMHPELTFEADVAAMLSGHQRLEQLLLSTSDASLARCGDELKQALTTLASVNRA